MPDTATIIAEAGDFHADDAATFIIDTGLAIYIDITPARQTGVVKPWDEHLPDSTEGGWRIGRVMVAHADGLREAGEAFRLAVLSEYADEIQTAIDNEEGVELY